MEIRRQNDNQQIDTIQTNINTTKHRIKRTDSASLRIDTTSGFRQMEREVKKNLSPAGKKYWSRLSHTQKVEYILNAYTAVETTKEAAVPQTRRGKREYNRELRKQERRVDRGKPAKTKSQAKDADFDMGKEAAGSVEAAGNTRRFRRKTAKKNKTYGPKRTRFRNGRKKVGRVTKTVVKKTGKVGGVVATGTAVGKDVANTINKISGKNAQKEEYQKQSILKENGLSVATTATKGVTGFVQNRGRRSIGKAFSRVKGPILMRIIAFAMVIVVLFVGMGITIYQQHQEESESASTGEYDGYTISDEVFAELDLPVQITKEMVVAALVARETFNVPPSVVIAQVKQESTGKYGPNELSGLAFLYKNLTGFKAYGSANAYWEGDSATMSNSAGTDTGTYRVYTSYANSIMDWGRLVSEGTSSGYVKAQSIDWNADYADGSSTGSHKNVKAFAKAVASSWATDPNYATSIISHMDTYNLYQLDTLELETTESTSTSKSGSAVVKYAIQFIGNPYVWGGTSLTNGCDCSGFVMSVYEHFGVSLPHSSSALRSVGTAVSRSDIAPGDIVCYAGHVGIYVGNNLMVNASNSKPYPEGGIKYTNIDYRTIVAIRRIFDADDLETQKITVTNSSLSKTYSANSNGKLGEDKTFKIEASALGDATLTFTKTSTNAKKITVGSGGKVTVAKGLKKGTYTIKVKIKAKETDEYEAKIKTVRVCVTVK